MKTLLLSTVGAAILAAGSAHAREATSRPDVGDAQAANAVETLVVTANRSAQRSDRIGQSVTVLDAGAIKASQAVAISDLLIQTPGVSLSRNGGVGQTTSLRIRGAETDQTVVVIDGVKLNDPSQAGGGYNFGNLLAGDASRVEVLRGAQSTLWGSQAIGGVVNIITARPTARFEGTLSVDGGSMNTSYLRGGVGGVGEWLTWRLAASHYVTSGISTYRFGAERDGYRNTGLTGRVNVKLADDVSVDLRAVYSKGRNEFDGFPAPLFAFADDPEYGTTKDLVTYGGLNFGLLNGRLQNRVAYGYTRTDRDNFNPTQAVTTTTFGARGDNKRWEYQGVFDIAHGWNSTFGAEHEDASMRTASPSSAKPNPAPIRGEAKIDSLYVQVQGTVLEGLTLTGGLRHDHHSTFGEKTLGQAAAAWSLNDGDTVLRASFGQGFKAPTLYQLYSQYGNTALAPEEADSWDAGLEQSMLNRRVKVSAAYFDRQTTNQIDFVSCPSVTTNPLCFAGVVKRSGYYDNTARTKARGVELAGSTKVGLLTLQGNYTWTEAKNDVGGSANFGKLLARRPEHQANLWVSWVWPAKVSTSVGIRYTGDTFDNVANTTRLKGYTLVDLRVSYPVTDAVVLYGRVENLTDKAYETTRNYGSPGRAGYVGVRARF
ncbi:TonB-dependent receptor plug domain-containing protein [Phenylobacterium sp.]|uniref:TonB-dependent receptor plug domain-containing protein n=1 Tax=Phenylobacterium sp. TaxID=1871053 RepID=UPI003BAD5342